MAIALASLSLVLIASPAAADSTVTASAAAAHELFATARELASADDREAAEAAWQAGLDLFGSDPYARTEYGRQLSTWGQPEEAAAQFEAAVALAPDNPDVLWAAGVFLRRNPDSIDNALEQSEVYLQRFVAVRPDDHRGWLELGVLALSREDNSLAAERFGRARDIAPFNLAASGYLAEALLRAGELQRAEDVLRDLLRKDPSQLRARLALSRMYTDREDPGAAIELLRGVPPEQASDPAVARRLAFLLAEARELEEAVALTSSLLSDTPGDLELRRLAVRLESASGRYETAADLLRVYVRANPEDVDAALELAEYLEMLGLEEESIGVLQSTQAALRDGTPGRRRSTLALLDLFGRRGDWQQVLQETRPMLEPAGSADWTVFPLHAEALFHQSGIRAARRFLDGLVDRDPQLGFAARAKQAELLLVAGREREAREVLDALIATDGPRGPSLAARVWTIRNLPTESVAPALEAVARAPENLELRFQLASIYDQSDRWDDAEHELLAILATNPDHAPSLNYLGYAWADRGTDQDTLSRALDLTRRAVELNPGNGAYQDSLGWAYFQLGRYQESLPHLERAAALVTSDPVILEHLGDLYRALGETNRARTFYQWAARIDADNDVLSNKLGGLSEDG